MDVESEITQAVEKYLGKTRRSGPDNISAPCPFHTKADGSPERNPSFAISTTTGLYLCHSCGARGNLFKFFRELGVERQEIELHYRKLINDAADNLPMPLEYRKAQLVDGNPINEALLGLFDYCPKNLLDAGFHEETLRHFEIGFDKWHYRVTYPIRDLAGKLTAIDGRSVTNAWPRHKVYNSEYKVWGLPEREGWEKANILYNAHSIYRGIYQNHDPNSFVVAVEGFKACMWLHQAGIQNVVAFMGHYMSVQHQWILEGLGAKVYLFLDNNWQGWGGARDAGLRLADKQWVKIVNYPERLVDNEDAQPDDCTPQEVQEQIATASDLYDPKARYLLGI